MQEMPKNIFDLPRADIETRHRLLMDNAVC